MLVKSYRSYLAALVAVGLLAACGGGSEEAPTTETGNTAPATEIAASSVETNEPDTPSESPISLNSNPINAKNARDAIEQLNDRDEARRKLAVQKGENINPILIDVSWPYGNCTDAASLIPPPKEGWRLFGLPLGEWPQDSDFARITYSSVDESLTPGTPEYGASKQNIGIYISSGTMDVDALKDLYTNEQLAPMMLDSGPYNYPIRKTPPGFPGRGVLLGDYFVQLDGSGKDMDAYFATIIRCGIDSGLIAPGVDAATLTDTP
ncbi:MAG: hypothetical protein AAFR51_05660 [Pseudomonadota bacterium]